MSDADRGREIVRSLRALQDGVQKVSPGAAAGYSLIGAIGLLGGAGYAWDEWRGSAPTGLVTGMLLGVGVGMYLLARDVFRRPR